MKLKDLLELAGTKITTTQTAVDPDTGKISWDVQYEPDFTDILNNITKLITDFDLAIKKHGIKDPSITVTLKGLRSIKSNLLKTLQTKYPEYIKDYNE